MHGDEVNAIEGRRRKAVRGGKVWEICGVMMWEHQSTLK